MSRNRRYDIEVNVYPRSELIEQVQEYAREKGLSISGGIIFDNKSDVSDKVKSKLESMGLTIVNVIRDMDSTRFCLKRQTHNKKHYVMAIHDAMAELLSGTDAEYWVSKKS